MIDNSDSFTFLPDFLANALVNNLEQENLIAHRPFGVNDHKVKILTFLSQYNITPKNFFLYEKAFTHSSYSRSTNNVDRNFHYERLEFLGDAIISFCVAKYLFKKYPNADEGELTCMRKVAIQKQAFCLLVKKLNLITLLRVGNNERNLKHFNNEKMLSNLFESLVGAIYLDQGMNKLESFLTQTLYFFIDRNKFKEICDYKSELQELIQRNNHCSIFYKDVAVGQKQNNLHFVTTIYLIKNQQNYALAQGKGVNKKKAQQVAAMHALNVIDKYLRS